MSVFRMFIALLATLVVAGCAEAPLLEEGATGSFAIRSVEVDTSEFKGVRGRVNEFSRNEVARDITANVKSTLRQAAQGTRPVDVKVDVERVTLVSPGQSLLIGGVSNISGKVEVRDARTGEIVLPSTPVRGAAKGTYAPGGIIGALSTRSVDNDYRATIAGFAVDVETRLFGTRRGEAVVTASPRPETSTADTTNEPLTDKESAIKRAELKARQKFHPSCSSMRCENAVARARKEAAQNTN